MSARHGGELRSTFQTYCNVAEFGEDVKVASNTSRVNGLSLYSILQDRCDVLANVVIASAFPEILGVLVVVTQREISDLCQVLRIQFHVRSGSHTRPACTRLRESRGTSKRSRPKAANAATIKKYLKPGVIRDLD